MRKSIIVRSATSFSISAMCGLITNMLIELIVRQVTQLDKYVPFSPEFIQLFPSKSIAVEVDILLYGLIGAVFAAGTFIFEKERLSFLVQNIIYFIMTSMVWIPIVVFMWQLQNHLQALIGTLSGFVITYVIIIVVSYKEIQQDINKINESLEEIRSSVK